MSETDEKSTWGGSRAGSGRPRLTDYQAELRGTRRWRKPVVDTRDADAAAARTFDDALIGFFLTWEFPRGISDAHFFDLLDLSHNDDLSQLRHHWVRLRETVCLRWRGATIDERRAWFTNAPAAVAIVSTDFPPAQWRFEMLGRGKSESEIAYRRRRGLERTDEATEDAHD